MEDHAWLVPASACAELCPNGRLCGIIVNVVTDSSRELQENKSQAATRSRISFLFPFSFFFSATLVPSDVVTGVEWVV